MEEPHSKRIRAVDMQRLAALKFSQLKNAGGLIVSNLPTTWIDLNATEPKEMAVVSWRWDIRTPEEPSINLAAAVCAGQQLKKRYLLMDLVSVAQNQDNDELIEDIANLSELYASISVIATYDQVDVSNWLLTMRRPWLFYEVRAFHQNNNKIIYVSHQQDQGGKDEFGFWHMLKRVWGTNYTSSVLLVLAEKVGIGKLSDFAYIIPNHYTLLKHAYKQLSRSDFLLTVAILCQVFEDDGRFHTDRSDESFDLCLMKFDRYQLESTQGEDPVYQYFNILLDGRKVASYHKRTKPDRFTSEPIYVRYLTANFIGGEIIHEIIHPISLTEYRSLKDQIGSLFSLEGVPQGDMDKHRAQIVRFY